MPLKLPYNLPSCSLIFLNKMIVVAAIRTNVPLYGKEKFPWYLGWVRFHVPNLWECVLGGDGSFCFPMLKKLLVERVPPNAKVFIGRREQAHEKIIKMPLLPGVEFDSCLGGRGHL